MSRIGKKPIILPSGVSVEVNDGMVTVKGGKGELTRPMLSGITVKQVSDERGEVVLVEREGDAASALWGTMRSHIQNMVHGVSEGWSKSLELNGVGFKMNVSGDSLKMSLGFSHEVDYKLAQGITATIEGNVLTISGADKETVGQVAAEIRGFKKPEPYKGKGFRYTDEIIRRKVGKAAKSD